MTTQEQKPSKVMNGILWAAQILLASSLIWAASMKLFKPINELAQMWPWVADNAFLVKFTGVIDLLGALGLILPGLFRIQPKLTIYAAYGIVLLMIAASAFHISRGEGSLIGINIFFLVLAVFIAWGRQKKAPLA